MTASEKTSTMMWIKQLSTTTIHTLSGKIRGYMTGSPLKRNIIIGVLAWLSINCLVFMMVQNKIKAVENTFYTDGAIQALALSEKIGESLLENDILSLNVAIGEETEKEGVEFAAVLDHQGSVLVHSDPSRINAPLEALTNGRKLRRVDGVDILTGKNPEGEKLIQYNKDVTYSDIKIGMVSIGASVKSLEGMLSSYRINRILFIALSAAAAILILFFAERTRKNRAEKTRKEMEDTSLVGPYVLTKKIAQGGMAELFLADYKREDGFKKTVAIKKVLPHLAENRDFINMFIREARLAALLQHPNIVQIADFGKIQNAYFLAMEYVDGKNLAEIMAHLKRGLDVDMAIFIITKIAAGLEYSHTKTDDQTGTQLHIVHRDISPQNMLISYQGEVKISDFGISKATSEPSLTQAGVIKGKLSYLSPEQAAGGEVDHQADIYALGLVFYEILTGKRLYRFSSDIEAIRSIPKMIIPAVKEQRPDIPDALNDIVMKCLEKDKSVRYQGAKELKKDLLNLKNKLTLTYDISSLSKFMRDNFTPD